MLHNNNTQNMLGLKDVIIQKVEDIGTEKHIYLKIPKRIHQCPNCHTYTSKVHDYRMQLVRDLPMAGMHTILHINKRRHVCPSCGKRFDEIIDFLPKYSRFTNRLMLKLVHEFEKCVSIKDVAKAYNMAPETAAKVLDYVGYTPNKLPEVLSIDEFRGNSGGEKFQCILTDAKNHKVFDILKNRTLDCVWTYLRKFQNRKDVKYVVMDMTGNYRYIMKELSNWIMYAQATKIPESVAVAKTYGNWSKEILNSVEVPFTNGYTEGCNNKIKVLKRISFGMPEFQRFRNRILHIFLSEA